MLDQPELAAYIPRAGAAPIGPFRLSPAGLSDIQDLLSPTVVPAAKSSPLGKILAGAAAIGVAAVILTDDDKSPSGQTRRQLNNQAASPGHRHHAHVAQIAASYFSVA